MTDVKRILKILAVRRPIFHSEADFQHALAWEVHQQCPSCQVRLEFKPHRFDKRAYVDIWVVDNDAVSAIELKHKTRGLPIWIGNEFFSLLDQSAQDIGRYDFMKDIHRLEQIVSSIDNVVGHAVFLTNDSAYWKTPRTTETVDADFRIHQGRILAGNLGWGTGASSGTMSGREKPIPIKGVYSLNWQDYSEPKKASYGKFRYLLVEINRKTVHEVT